MEVESTSRLRIKYLWIERFYQNLRVDLISQRHIHCIDFEWIFRKRVNSLLFSHPPPFIVLFFLVFFYFVFVFFFCSSLLMRYRLTDPRATSILKISTRTNVQIFVIRNVHGKKRFKRMELMTEEFNFSRATSILLQFDLHMVCDTFITLWTKNFYRGLNGKYYIQMK